MRAAIARPPKRRSAGPPIAATRPRRTAWAGCWPSGDLAGAEDAFRRADDRGDAAAAFSLGGLLAERGDLAGAEDAFRRADERGHVAGVFNLGVLLEERGDLAGAEAAYRRAEERGHGEVAEMARAALLELWGQR
jgi:TPR repeat protein